MVERRGCESEQVVVRGAEAAGEQSYTTPYGGAITGSGDNPR